MKFKDFFGINQTSIKKNCIICQTYDAPLFSDKTNNGFFVKTAETDNAIIIALKNNFLAGDTVLYLKDTSCENIFLFGSCGGCGDIESGDIVMIEKAFNFESFSQMLKEPQERSFSSSSEKLLSSFYEKNPYQDLIKTNSACVSSLMLEAKYLDWFKSNGVNALDMESSIVLSAAKGIGKNAICVMYVADHIEKSPLGTKLNAAIKKQIAKARTNLAKMLINFTDER